VEPILTNLARTAERLKAAKNRNAALNLAGHVMTCASQLRHAADEIERAAELIHAAPFMVDPPSGPQVAEAIDQQLTNLRG
jgi:hypothetical protein